METRRNFLKLGAATAGAAAAGQGALISARELERGGKDYSPRTGKERQAIPTACWQCVTRCAAIGYVEEGRLVKIEPQPNSIRTEGKLCAKGQAGVNQVYDPDRVLYPLRRVGARGEGIWKRISWDEALTEVATRLKKLRDEGHPEKFMFHYGRMKASSSKLIKSLFLGSYGTATVGNHTSICEGGKWTAQELTWGKHYDNWDLDNTRYVLNFGSNCLEAHTNHTPIAERMVKALVDKRVKLVTFDVRLSNTAAKSDEWVPVRSGTDGAVALAMCNVVMNEGLYRGEGEAFLEFCKVTPGREATLDDKVAALKAHLAAYTPEWAEGVSGVSAGKIRSIAREFATTKPACVISYRGAIAHYNGNDAERAIQMLAAITGNIDNPGGRCRGVGAKWKYPHGPKDKPKARKLKILDGFKGQAALPTHHMSHHVLKMIKDGSAGRPEVYMWYCYAPVYSNGEVGENIEVLKDESLIPFTVSVNPFYDESAALADLILPDATYLERWDWEDMVSPNGIPEYYIRQPVVKPLGETRDFGDVVCELAERMGFPLGVASKEEFVRMSCEMTPGVKEAGGFEYMKRHGVWHDPNAKPKFSGYKKHVKAADLAKDGVVFDEATGVYWNWRKSKAKSEDEALEKGYAHTKNAYKGYVGQKIGDSVYTGFEPDKVNKSGYFEFYSDVMEAKGLAPLPTYVPIPGHQRMAENDLILTTFKVNVQTHSRTQNCKWLTEIYHDNPAWINPLSADKLGIGDGDAITIRSETGEMETTARVTPAIVPGAIAVSFHCGHWEYGRYASSNKSPTGTDDDPDLERKWWTANGAHPNWIIPNVPDPINGQQCWMDAVVAVTKV
ncbi:MAG: molybdopterin-dependent oxidoreductase [Alphaproteobacteria bacterium]